MKAVDLPDVVASPAPQLALGFARRHGGPTFLQRQRVAYPFHVGRTLQMPGDPAGFCTVYLQSCAGGIFQHDRLLQSMQLADDAQAHITTGASAIVHSMDSGHAEQHLLLEAGENAFAEYLPDPLILFPRSRLDTRLLIRAHRSATVIACESFLLHDPAARNEPFDWLRAETRIEDEAGRLLAADRFRVEGATIAARIPGITGLHSAQATLMVVHRADPALVLAALRASLRADSPGYAGASLLPNGAGAWLRVLAGDAIGLRAVLHDAWVAARTALTGAPPGVRRK